MGGPVVEVGEPGRYGIRSVTRDGTVVALVASRRRVNADPYRARWLVRPARAAFVWWLVGLGPGVWPTGEAETVEECAAAIDRALGGLLWR